MRGPAGYSGLAGEEERASGDFRHSHPSNLGHMIFLDARKKRGEQLDREKTVELQVA